METEQKLLHICKDIWELGRSSLTDQYPFFRAALYSLSFQEEETIHLPGFNGITIFYSPKQLIRTYQQNPEIAEQTLLHMLIHLLYLHPLLSVSLSDPLWDLACDLSVCRILSHSEKERDARRIYEHLQTCNASEALPEPPRLDDHRFWTCTKPEDLLPHICRIWDSVKKEKGTGSKGNGSSIGSSAGNQVEQLITKQKQAQRFRRYLKRFAVSREEIRLDLESFDYIPYLYGLNHYGNMPLIEHLEYQEVHKLEELVIAIDTSGSCSADTIRRFMEETYTILSDRENFFKKMNLYILQCDFCIQHEAHITCEQDWKTYLKDLVVHGRSGTDFRPVFERIEVLRKEKKLRNLKALLYFTDGDGIYPEKQTDYETAFIFLREKPLHQKVPGWARVFTLDGGLYEY